MNLLDLFASSDKASSLGYKFRARRIAFFKEAIATLPKPVRILDVGGLESLWSNGGFANDPNFQITILNLDERPCSCSNIRSVKGDATHMPDIADSEYDIVFSNSVIEHVYTWENQIKMAAELMRVGRYYFVQTPNRHFFLEPHYILPFFQYLPDQLQVSILTLTPLSRGRRWSVEEARQYVREIRLISLREMKVLFPGAKLYFEKFMGLNKSFTAHNFPGNS